MNLRLLAPDIQEQLLNLPRVERGRNSLCLRLLQNVALKPAGIFNGNCGEQTDTSQLICYGKK